MKSCCKEDCTQINPQTFDNFHKRSDAKDGLSSQCKSCKSRNESKRYFSPELNSSNKPRHHGKIYKLYKKDKCERCTFIPQDLCQLDVDHIDGNKSNNEPSNLQTLCANCHRLKTKLNRDTRWK